MVIIIIIGEDSLACAFYIFKNRDFPGGPVVKTSPSNAGGAGLIPGPGGKTPHPSQPKNENILVDLKKH